MGREWQTGDRLENRWEILKVMKGGMGVVYVVHDHEWNEALAAKTFQDSVFARNPRIAPMFTREALAWVQLDAHPNIAQALFVQEIDGKPVLFLEYVSGGDLSEWIGTPRLTEDLPLTLRFAMAFCDGMIHARAKGIYAHRDIKPQNCLIAGDGTLKVTDFGLAKVFDADDGADQLLPGASEGGEEKLETLSFSRTGNAAGTVTHMAPEQFIDSKHVGVEADVYAFGVMLFQMLVGRLPFSGRSWDDFENKHQTQAPPVEDVAQPELRAVVARCLQKRPEDRYRDFEQVREPLAALYRQLTGADMPPPVTGRELDMRQWLNKGVSLAALGFKKEAMGCYDQALRIDPGYAEAWANKGNIFKEAGELTEAVSCFDRALALNPKAVLAWYNKGGTLEMLGRPEEALACLDQALSLNPLMEMAWSSRGVALGKLGRNEEALASFEKATRIHPRFAAAWAMMGNHHRTLGRLEEALACHDRALEFNTNVAEIWYNRANVLADLKRDPEALAGYDKALRINPQLAAAWAGKANLYRAEGKLKEAVANYERALELDPREANWWHNKAVTLQKAGRLEEALAAFTEYLQLQPEDADGWVRMGGVFDELERAAESKACYEKAIAVNPRNALAWHNSAVSAKRWGQLEQALQMHEKAVEIDPKLEEAWLGKANLLADLGRAEEAYAAYDHVLALNPKFTSAWFSKGATLGNADRYQEALVCFERALELGHPNAARAAEMCRSAMGKAEPPPPPPAEGNADTWRDAAVNHLRKGEFEESLACFEKAVGMNPRASGAWLGKAVALDGLRRYEEAIASVDAAITLHPDLAVAWNKKGELLVRGFQRYEDALLAFQRAQQLGHSAAAEGIAVCQNALASQQPAAPKEDAGVWIQRGADFDAQGNTDQALASYEKALEVEPSSGQAWFGKAIVLGKLGRHEEELACYDKALAIAPEFGGAWFNKGRTLGGRLKRYREALTCFEKARELGHPSAEQAIEICRRGLAEAEAAAAPPTVAPPVAPVISEPPAPINPEELLNRANALAREGRIDEGLACCEQVLKVHPGAPAAWNGKAMVFMFANRFREAITAFEKARELGGDPVASQGIALCREALGEPVAPPAGSAAPADALALHAKGQSFDSQGRAAEALECFEKALALSPRAAEIWYDKGVVLGKLDRSEEEIAAYDQALAIDPGMATAWFNKAITLGSALQRFQEALECFEKAHALGYPGAEQGMQYCRKELANRGAAPGDSAAEAAAWHEKGKAIVVRGGPPAEALPCFEKALELNPKLTDSWWGKGVVLGQMGQLEESLAAFDGALAVDPRLTGPLMSKAAALANANRFREALPCFEKAWELGDPTAVQGMIYCRQALGLPPGG